MSHHSKTFQTVNEAYQFLEELGALPKLILHVKLVGEAADLLISKLHELQVQFDESFLRLGVAFHDAGKIIHPEELTAKGNNHEADGENLLINNGVDSTLARCCRSHAQWQTIECSFEEICVALSDTLWKGKRNNQLEDLFMKMLVKRSHKEYWELFIEMDSCFEKIASDGHLRLLRSQAV
ncbi:phosphohydrolase [Nostoc sp. FACHB-110]|uniref:phosphohydrolase n=1 Tax=Nostoc sp. FACHB-110 TaxID=2692834 RepID=UPI001686274D|nr:phosphohydrolase [Nostoc sp. FACHB-110]MBD2436296.1 phosphohydrolase [Nostoc sp. FACHB-110]